MANLISHSLTTTMLLIVALFAMTPTIESLCSDAIFITLIKWLHTLSSCPQSSQHHHHNSTAAAATRLTYLTNRPLGANTVCCHVSSAGTFPYQSTLSLPLSTTLPTLHHNTKLTVGTNGKIVSFNDVLVVVPYIYLDGSCAVHDVGPLVPIPPSVDNDGTRHSEVVIPKRQERQISTHALFIGRMISSKSC